MSDMKCPVCNKGTVKEFETAPYFVCSNELCPSYSETDTTEYDILMRTRKALDVAMDALKHLNSEGKRTRILGLVSITDGALKQINEITKGGKDESNIL